MDCPHCDGLMILTGSEFESNWTGSSLTISYYCHCGSACVDYEDVPWDYPWWCGPEVAEALREEVVFRSEQVDTWRMSQILNQVTEQALKKAIENELETTFAPSLQEIAREKARRTVEKRQKRLGLATADQMAVEEVG